MSAGTFEDFVSQIAPDLLRYFVRRVAPQQDAADCVAETLVVLWRRSRDLPTDEDARRAWSFGVAHGILRNYRRGRARQLALADRLRGALEVSQPAAHGPAHPELVDALVALKEDDRELILLVAWDGLSLVEASRVLGIKEPAARARYSRARARLRQRLARQP